MKTITIVATASVAIIKLEKIVKLLKKKYQVNVLGTKNAFKHYKIMHKLATHQINTDLEKKTEHIDLASNTDLFIVAPASANTISKFVCGIADDITLTTLLAAQNKILFAPAMNDYMFDAIKKRNYLNWLEDQGHYVVGPKFGYLKEGYRGWGRMSEPEEIVEVINNIFQPKLKHQIVVSYGAGKVFIDPVRYITNNSSGKFGKLIIKHLKMKGLNVIGVDASKHSNKEIFEIAKKASIYVANGSLADFSLAISPNKIQKQLITSLPISNAIDVVEKLAQTKVKILAFKLDDNPKNALNKKNKLNLKGMFWNKINTMNSNLVDGALYINGQKIKFDHIPKHQAAKIIAHELLKWLP